MTYTGPTFVDGQQPYLNAATFNPIVRAVERASIVVNVKDFGAVGDGVTDDSAAFASAASYIASQSAAMPTNAPWPGGGGERVGRAEMYVPPGAYLITADDSSFIAPPSGGNTQGLTIRGAGRYVTQIIYKPATVVTDRFLVKNSGASANGWLNIHFQDLHFYGATTNCSWMLSTGPVVQNYTFQRVYWTNFKYGIHNQGTDNNDHFRFWHCGGFGTWDTFLWTETSDQFVSYQFDHFDWEVTEGTLINATLGGDITYSGGSLIMVSPSTVAKGTIFKLAGASHSDGAMRFRCQNTRVELRNANGKMLTSDWGSGVIAFDQVDMSAFATASYALTSTTFTVNNVNGTMPLVRFDNCKLIGLHEYSFMNQSYAYDNPITFNNCEIRPFTEAKDMITYTNSDSTGNIGGAPVARFRHCRGGSLNTSRFTVVDTEVGWSTAGYSRPEPKVMGIKAAFGTNPYSAFTTVSVKMPLNSIVTRVFLYMPAQGSSTSTAWSFTLRDTQGSPFTIASKAGGGTIQLKDGFQQTTNTWAVLDTDAKRSLDLVANASVDTTSTGFQCLVEYIG